MVFLINNALVAQLHMSTNSWWFFVNYLKSRQKDGQILMVPLGKKEQETPVRGLNIRMH